MRHLRHLRLWFGLGLLMVGIVGLLSLTNLPLQAQQVMLHDKWVHFGVYAILALWFGQLVQRRDWLLGASLALMCFGLAMELFQAQVPGRYAEVADMLANCVGVVAGSVVSLSPLGSVLQRFERSVLKR